MAEQEMCISYLLLSSSKPGSNNSWPQFTVQLLLVTFKPSTSDSHLQTTWYLIPSPPGQAQETADLGLHQRTSQKTSEPTNLVAYFRTTLMYCLTTSVNNITQRANWAGSRVLLLLLYRVSPCIAAPLLQSWPVPTTNQPKDQSLSLTCKEQPRLIYNRRSYTMHTRKFCGAPGSGDRGDCSTVPHRKPTT